MEICGKIGVNKVFDLNIVSIIIIIIMIERVPPSGRRGRKKFCY